MNTWKLSQGAGDSWIVPIVDGDGVSIAYTAHEELRGSIWPGGERSALITFTPSWYSGVQGLTSVVITADHTASLSPDTYHLQCVVVDEVGPKVYYRGLLQILASPGTEPTPPTYNDTNDLATYAPWIDQIQPRENGQAGFALQCAQARAWLDSIILNHYEAPRYGYSGYWYDTDTPSKWLTDHLTANRLMVTDMVKEICAKRALYLICASQLGKQGEDSYQDLARRFRAESNEMVKALRVAIDTNGDGHADVFVDCGSNSILR